MKSKMFSKFLALALLLSVSFLCLLVFTACGETPAGDGDNDTTAADNEGGGTTPEPTPAPTTLPTEPPTELKTELIHIDKMADWSAEKPYFSGKSPNVESITYEDGVVKLESNAGDPYILSPQMGLQTADIDIIRLRVKNLADSYRMQIFVTTSAGGWLEDRSAKSMYEYGGGDDEWEDLDIWTEDIGDWEGDFKQWRYDFLETEGEVWLESVSFLKVIE